MVLEAESKAATKAEARQRQKLFLKQVLKNGTFTAGPFAGEGVPATNEHRRNFISAQRKVINEQGYTLGCHTCNQTTSGIKSGNFILDHQPANAFVPNG